MNIMPAAVLILLTTSAHCLWLTLVGSQHSPTLLLVTYNAVLWMLGSALWSRFKVWNVAWRIVIGAALGYLAATITGAATQVNSFGWDLAKERGFDLTFFPVQSLGWLHGAATAAILSLTHRRERKTANVFPERKDPLVP